MQVGAGALAAATALFFSSSIGIAGTVLGAAVGSVVTTFSSTLYKSFLTASDSAIKRKMGIGAEGEEEATEEATAGPLGAHGETAVMTPSAAGATQTLPRSDAPTEAFAADATPAVPGADDGDGGADATSVFIAAQARSQEHVRVRQRRLAELRRVRGLARQRKERRMRQIVAGVSLVTGVVAVAVCAAIILVATNGSGLGNAPQPGPAGDATVAARETAAGDATEAAASDEAGQDATGAQAGQTAPDPAADVATGESEGGQTDAATAAPSGETANEASETTTATTPSEGQADGVSADSPESDGTSEATDTNGSPEESVASESENISADTASTSAAGI